MKPEIKEMYSLQLMQKIEDFWPEHINNFGISIRLMIGPENSKASESFDILVCTPDWIKDQFKEERCTWGLGPSHISGQQLCLSFYNTSLQSVLDLPSRYLNAYAVGCSKSPYKQTGVGAFAGVSSAPHPSPHAF